MNSLAPLVVAAFALLVGCSESPDRIAKDLRQEIQEYRANPTDEARIDVEKGFIKLDEKIATLEKAGKTTDVARWQQVRGDLASDFAAAKVGKVVGDVQNAIRGITDTIENAGKKIGETLEPSPTPR